MCCRKGDLFQGWKRGSCLTLRNELSKETHVLIKQEILLGKGTGVESSRVREPRRTALPHGSQSQVLWWWDSFPGCLWPIILAQESFLVVHTLLSQDGCYQEGFWEVFWHVVSPFDLSRTFPVGGGLLVPCSLPGPLVIKKKLMQMVTREPGQGGRLQSVCFP